MESIQIKYVIKNQKGQYYCYTDLSDFYWDDRALKAIHYDSEEDAKESLNYCLFYEEGLEPLKVCKVLINLIEIEL